VSDSPLADVQLHLVDSLDEAMEFKRWLGERHEYDLVGLDTESGGLSPYRDRLRMVQFGDTVHGWAIPTETWLGLAQEALRTYQGDYVLHNSGYDWQVIKENAGVTLPWHKLDDTMSLAHIDNPDRPKGLKPLGDRLVDPRASSGQYLLHEGMSKQGWTWDTVPYNFDPYWIYSALDPVLTAHIYGKLKYAKTQYATPYDIERAAIRYTAEMSNRGVRVDLAYVKQKIDELSAYIEKAKAWIKSEYGFTSVASSKAIANALKEDGLEIVFFTDTGQPRMDKDALKFYATIADQVSPDAAYLIETIRQIRKAEKMVSAYFENFQEMCVGDRLHCSIHPCAAATSRMSISDPSMQNLPTDDKLVRGAILAEEGHVLVSSDFNQVEMRLAADFSGDANLIETFRKADAPGGKPFFLQVASDIFGEEISKLDKRYGLTKNVGYGYLYGAGLEKMAATAGVPVSQMAPVRQAFLDRYPGLEEMSQRIIEEGKANGGYVETPTGRRLVVPKGKEYVLVNRKTQCHAAEVLKLSGMQLDNYGLMDYAKLPIHDEWLFSVPEDQAEEMRAQIEDAMRFDNYRVPITAGAEILGQRWIKK
jgi:DNA polymerase I